MKERISNLLKSPKTLPIAVGISAFSLGVVVGFAISRRVGIKIIETKIVDVSEELKEISEELDLMESREKHPSKTDKFVEAIDEIIEKSRKKPAKLQVVSKIEEETEIPVNQTVFANDTSDWNYEEELKHRRREVPYVIHKDEFFADEMDFTQSTFTYYAGDDIMADEDDSPIYNYKTRTGELKFGHGSDDPNVVYIRNEKLKAEYEVLYDSGLFSVEVMGLQIEDNERVKNLKHSNVPKFKKE